MNAQDVIVNATAGAAIVFVGTIVISLVRSTKLLDDDKEKVITQANASIVNLSNEIAELKAPKRSGHEQHHYQEAKKYLDTLPDDAKQVLREILSHERLVGGRVGQIYNVQNDRAHQILNGNILQPLVMREDINDPGMGLRATWVIVPGYKKALTELLYPSNS